MKSNCKNELVKLLSVCGQIAEHKSEKMQQHNMDDADLLLALSKEEQEALEEMLTRLKKRWMEDHKKRMQEKKLKESESN